MPYTGTWTSVLRTHRDTYGRIHDQLFELLWLSCKLHVLEDFIDQDTLKVTRSTTELNQT